MSEPNFLSTLHFVILYSVILISISCITLEDETVTTQFAGIKNGTPDIAVSLESDADLELFLVSRSQNVSFEEDKKAGFNVMRVNVPKGNHYGMEMDYYFEGVEDVHMRWQQYIPSHWTSADGTHMKFPGIGNRDRHGWGGRRTDGTGGWSVRTGVRDRTAYDDSLSVEFYVYHMDMGDWGSVYSWESNEDGAVMRRGEWTELETYVRVNTPGERDGVIRGWVNGKLVFEKTDLGFRAEGYEQYDIREIMWHVYHGGSEPSPLDQHIYLRDLEIWLGDSSNK